MNEKPLVRSQESKRKYALVKFQSQVLFHFNQSKDGQERMSLLTLVVSVEHSLSVLQEEEEAQENQGKSPFAKDPSTFAAEVLLKKGEISTMPPYTQVEAIERLLRKEACR